MKTWATLSAFGDLLASLHPVQQGSSMNDLNDEQRQTLLAVMQRTVPAKTAS
ncbi:hypothetical protein [Halomonas sp. PA16-9]|uniref:hypothetical protein n=1 Tax=Halomonas sp. PA16-9 TaxID=2576841 RepID=UPI0030EF28E8